MKTRIKTALSAVITAASAALATAASAATTISVDSVVQRWPWNNKVDITYTIVGGQNLAAEEYKKIVFTTVINGTTYTIDGTTDVGASANAGTHTVTWTLPDGVQSTNCTMSAAVYAADVPSGDDYMIIDLTKTSDNITWEGFYATQDASNSRYNTNTYKQSKLVLRKVPRWARRSALPNAAALSALDGYPTGDNTNYSTTNSRKDWPTDRDYYIGVFPVTASQYAKVMNATATSSTKPQVNVSWDDLRLSTTASTSSIPVVIESNSGTFLQRLNYITGNKFGFDLPTEVMFEIAERAGATTTYYWGDSMVKSNVVSSDNGGSLKPVGSRPANAWGLYDTCGNAYEWCLDSNVSGNLTARVDAFTPFWADVEHRRSRGGGDFYNPASHASFHASYRGSLRTFKQSDNETFRISWIAD